MIGLLAVSLGALAYTFVGYPALVALLARARPRPIRTRPGFTPLLSVIVLAYNEAAEIVARVENLRELDYPQGSLELIVVTDGSRDATPELARATGATVLHQPDRRGKMAAMNRGARAASGDVLLFSDANNRYTPGSARAVVAPFADPDVGVVTGRKVIEDGAGRPLDRAEGAYWRYEAKIREWESASGSTTGVNGEMIAFRRDAFPTPPDGTMNEDFVQAMMAAAAGWRVVYVADAVSLERASATASDELTRRSRLVTGRAQALAQLVPGMLRHQPGLALKLISHKGLRPLVPLWMLAALASNALLAFDHLWAKALLAAQLGFYALAALGWVAERAGKRNKLLFVPYYFCRANLATLRGLWQFVTGRREAVWERVSRA